MRTFLVWVIMTLGLWLGATTPEAAQSAGSDQPGTATDEIVFTRGSGPRRPRVDQTRHDQARTSLGILSDRPRIRPTRTETPPVIDGRLDDPIWQTAAMITNFVQQSPLDRAPATEDTEVYLAYDRDHLYFGFYLHYGDPELMRANRVDRDRAPQDDLMTIYFDTFMDQQRVYDFDINAYNVQGLSLIHI